MTTNFSEKSEDGNDCFRCEHCDYTCFMKQHLKQHFLSQKHKRQINNAVVNSDNNTIQNKNSIVVKKHECICGSKFNDRAGLWRHKKKCYNKNILIDKEHDITDKELIIMLLKENKELRNMMLDQNSMIIDQNSAVLELCKNGTHNTTNNNNTNSHNKTFNLQFFLNETCKNAMNISDFVRSIQVQLSDLEKVGELGYIDGISNIIVKNLHDLDITERPIHCTDKKREVLYIKDENKWEKEDEDNNKLRRAIKQVSFKNSKMLSAFREKHPDYSKSESKYADQYNKLVIEAMGGKGDNDMEKENKIIKNIAKEVLIEK
jgi:hypothetical protein